MSDTQFSVQKLNNENYLVWSYNLELLSIKKKLCNVVMEDKADPAAIAWTQKTNETRIIIGLLVKDNQLLDSQF